MTAHVPEPGPLPHGVLARPATRDDTPALLALLRAEEFAGTGETSLVAAEIEHWFDSERSRERGVTRVLERDGVLIGVWRVYRYRDDSYPITVAVDRALNAETVDALWQAGLAWIDNVAFALADSLDVAHPRLDLWVFENDGLVRRHAEASGFEQARAFIELQIDLAGYSAGEPNQQVSVRLAAVEFPDSPDLRLVHELITESFRDHFDFKERSFEEWVEGRVDDPLGDHSHWYVAELDGTPVGALLGHNAYIESDAGYIANLGVLRAGRGKGVAKALLHSSFARYAGEGRDAVKLHVDAESPTGATHLYERVGMYRRIVGFDFFKWPRGKAPEG